MKSCILRETDDSGYPSISVFYGYVFKKSLFGSGVSASIITMHREKDHAFVGRSNKVCCDHSHVYEYTTELALDIALLSLERLL